ncbi:MAG: hypothetical protein KGJ62_10760 [Armatimonadetes bacterium]|nr:hypothetical protein [Armatimonadota bacterium]MDE2206759.1 hypothetical protein [Armatimonadota bacterium]
MPIALAVLAASAGLALTARIMFLRGQPAQRRPLAACAAAWFASSAGIWLWSMGLSLGMFAALACALVGFGIWLRHIWRQSLSNTTM